MHKQQKLVDNLDHMIICYDIIVDNNIGSQLFYQSIPRNYREINSLSILST